MASALISSSLIYSPNYIARKKLKAPRRPGPTQAPPVRVSSQLREDTFKGLQKSYIALPEVVTWKPGASRKRPLRLLSLDGGGVRGIGILHILKHIMSKAGAEGIKPCDYFDMITGTSTGGLIAIMLGRLDMSIDDCITAYKDLSSKIFGKNRGLPALVRGHSRYKYETFEEIVKDFIKSRTGDSESLMMQTHTGDHCKVFVVAVQADNVNNGKPLHIRTYQPGEPENEPILKTCKIWEACRATTAAPSYFDPMKIDGAHYQDGGLGHNNPACLLKAEAEVEFGRDTPIACTLSIGTGLVPMLDLRDKTSIRGVLSGSLRSGLLTLVTNTQQHHLLARKLFNSGNPGCYFRFNVGEKLADKEWVDERGGDFYRSLYGPDSVQKILPNLDDWKNALIALDNYKEMDKFAGICEEYIQDESLVIPLERCARRLQKI